MALTRQQIFDTVLARLREQGRASVNERGHCAYRGENGAKCAVGHLMPDDKFDPEWEGSVYDLPDEAFEAMGVSGDDLGFLLHLQKAHDECLDARWMSKDQRREAWEARMKSVAAQFELDYTDPEVAHG